jgi:hypothetical protein
MSARDYDIKDRMLSEFADKLCKKITNQTISDLRAMKDCLLSGDDSSLNNVWDEICVQVQYEESVFWDSYLDVISSMIKKRMAPLETYEKMAIWWQKGNPEDALEENEDDFNSFFFDEDESCDYIINNYILSSAADYTNQAIRTYLDNTSY